MSIMRTKLFLQLLAITALAILTLPADSQVGHTPQEINNPRAKTSESITTGRQIFFTYCSGCHGRRADGRGGQALNLVPKPQNLRNPYFITYLDDTRIYTSISGGVRGTAMPAFEMILNKNQRWDTINFIRSLASEDTPALENSIVSQVVPADAVNPYADSDSSWQQGKVLFEANCVSCHGSMADGRGVLAPNLVPAPRNLVVITSWGENPFLDYMADARLYESITNGVPGTSMQPWIGVLSDAQRWHLVSHLRHEASLRHGRIELGHA